MAQRLKYREENIALIKTSVENYLRTNQDFGYSVKVSGFLVIPRTRDITLFDSFKDHVNEMTDTVVFTNYYGSGNTGEAITLYVSEDRNRETDLSGTNTATLKVVNERSELRRQIMNELQNEYLTQENERLKKDLNKAQKFIGEVDVLLAQLRQQRSQVKDKGTLEVIGNFVARLAAANPDLLKENPTIEAFISLLPSDPEKQPPPPVTETPVSGTPDVTIKPKQAEQNPEVAKLLMVLKELRRHFSEIEFDKCLHLLKSLADNKELIPYAIQWVQVQIEEKKQWLERQQRGNERDQEETITHEPETKTEPEIGHEQKEEPKINLTDYDDDGERPFHP